MFPAKPSKNWRPKAVTKLVRDGGTRPGQGTMQGISEAAFSLANFLGPIGGSHVAAQGSVRVCFWGGNGFAKWLLGVGFFGENGGLGRSSFGEPRWDGAI